MEQLGNIKQEFPDLFLAFKEPENQLQHLHTMLLKVLSSPKNLKKIFLDIGKTSGFSSALHARIQRNNFNKG